MQSKYQIGDRFKYYNYAEKTHETIEIIDSTDDEFIFQSGLTPYMPLSEIDVDNMIENKILKPCQ
jgi:hypothetical protein